MCIEAGMAIDSLSLDDLRTAVAELEQCLYNHDQWMDALFATLICRVPPDDRDLCADAHHKCRLGQWYFSESPVIASLSKQAGFSDLGKEHERMHVHAANMLLSVKAGETVPLQEYQRFVNAQKNMRLGLVTLKEAMEKALHGIDPLTGVPGRFGMLTKLSEQQALVEREIQHCLIAMMDLDNFKLINDQFGHAAGDRVLMAFTRQLTQDLRPYDNVFRYGGEEFVIVLPDTNCDEGREIIERLRETLASTPQSLGADAPVFVTASFGLALLETGVPVEKSIDRADRALYEAKAAGRNCCVIWDSSMTANPSSSGATAAQPAASSAADSPSRH